MGLGLPRWRGVVPRTVRRFGAEGEDPCCNWSLVGASPARLDDWGYPVTTVPNVDDRFQACMRRAGVASTECWVEFDQYLMTEVVPWVPLIFVERTQVVSERVVRTRSISSRACPRSTGSPSPLAPSSGMRSTGMRAPLVGVVTLLLLAAACTGEDRSGSPSPADDSLEGERFGSRSAVFLPGVELDPHWRSYYSLALTRCCVHRTLYSYNGRPTDEGGAELRPDLATGIPEVSSDGLRWTFRLRRGLRYAPPFEETEIVAADLVRALEREARVGQRRKRMAPYYSVIHGFDDYAAGARDSIVGSRDPG